MRNITTQSKAAQKQIEDNDQMTLDEMKHLQEMARDKSNPDGLWDAIATAFYFGYAVGRAAKDK